MALNLKFIEVGIVVASLIIIHLLIGHFALTVMRLQLKRLLLGKKTNILSVASVCLTPNGLGGTPAAVGYSNGLSGAVNVSFQLPGSFVSGALLDGGPAATSLVANSLNSDVLGRYTLNARNGTVVVNPPSTAVPEPFTIVGTLIGATAAFRTRQRLKASNKL